MSNQSLHPTNYLVEGRKRKVAESVLLAADRKSKEIAGTGSVPILSLGHLASLTGASANYLRSVVDRSTDPYLEFERPKRTGGSRVISAPDPILMVVQRWLLDHALTHVRPHANSFAYQLGRSSIHCSQMHVGARWLVKMDLRNFFGTVNEYHVYRIFREANYSSLVSFELARIVTRVQASPVLYGGKERKKYPVIRGYAVISKGVLPQGGPTSGMLANAVMRKVDKSLAELASSAGLTYTRYSDDLTFSTAGTWTRDAARTFLVRSTRIIENAGFELQKNKTRVIPPGARHVVLGLLVDDDRVRLMPEFRKKIEGHIRNVHHFGLVEHCKHRGFRSVLSFVRFIDGHLAHATAVDPSWADKARLAWDLALRASYFPVSGKIE